MISSQVFSFYQHEPGFILKSLNTIKIHLKYRVPFLKKKCGWLRRSSSRWRVKVKYVRSEKGTPYFTQLSKCIVGRPFTNNQSSKQELKVMMVWLINTWCCHASVLVVILSPLIRDIWRLNLTRIAEVD